MSQLPSAPSQPAVDPAPAGEPLAEHHSLADRRHFLRSLGLGGAAAAACLAWRNETSGATQQPAKTKPLPTRFKTSLAAYSLREQLPNYRGKTPPPPQAALDMAGFLDYCATLDIDAAEITSYFLPHPCPRELALELRRKAHQLGLDISGGAIGNNFSLPDGAELDEQMAYTERWVESYAAMGAPVIRVFAGHPKDKSQPAADAEKNIIKNLQHACGIAARHGVILGVENHDFTTDIDRMLRILEAVDSPWFGLNFDSGNLADTPDPYADLKRIAPHTVNAQLKIEIPRNGKREPADFKRIVDILGEAGYRGYLVLEYESSDPYGEIPKYLDLLREAIG